MGKSGIVCVRQWICRVDTREVHRLLLIVTVDDCRYRQVVRTSRLHQSFWIQTIALMVPFSWYTSSGLQPNSCVSATFDDFMSLITCDFLGQTRWSISFCCWTYLNVQFLGHSTFSPHWPDCYRVPAAVSSVTRTSRTRRDMRRATRTASCLLLLWNSEAAWITGALAKLLKGTSVDCDRMKRIEKNVDSGNWTCIFMHVRHVHAFFFGCCQHRLLEGRNGSGLSLESTWWWLESGSFNFRILEASTSLGAMVISYINR